MSVVLCASIFDAGGPVWCEEMVIGLLCYVVGVVVEVSERGLDERKVFLMLYSVVVLTNVTSL